MELFLFLIRSERVGFAGVWSYEGWGCGCQGFFGGVRTG